MADDTESNPNEKMDYVFIIVLKDGDSFKIERQMTDANALEFYKSLVKMWYDAKSIDAIAFPQKRGHMMSEIWKKVGLV